MEVISRVIHNTYQGVHIETDHHVICLMPEVLSKHFLFPKFTASWLVKLRKVNGNDTKTRDQSFPQWVRGDKRSINKCIFDAENLNVSG